MTSNFENPPESALDKGDWKVAAAIALLVFVAAAPVMQFGGEQQASRYALTAALWDNQTVELGEDAQIGRDHAVRDGVIYSDKAPGQPFLAVPFYGIYRILGGDAARLVPRVVDFGLWWATLWTALVPAAALAVLMYRWSREIEPRTALAATLTLSFGTLLLVYSTLLFGHVLAAVLVFAMFLIIRRVDVTWMWLALSGFLGGLAVLTEYPAVLIVAVLVLAAVIRHRAAAFWVVAGGAPAAVALGLYNLQVTGSPFVVPYQWTAFSGPVQEVRGPLEIFAGPGFDNLIAVVIGERGLFVAAPVLLVAVLGTFLLWRRGQRFDAGLVFAAIIAMIAVQASWGSPYAGGAGPRYVTPALPFLAAPLAVAWVRWRVATPVLAGISVVTMVFATLTNPQMNNEFRAGLRFWVQEAINGEFAPTTWTLIVGKWGWLIYAATVIAAGILLWRLQTQRSPMEANEHADDGANDTSLVISDESSVVDTTP